MALEVYGGGPFPGSRPIFSPSVGMLFPKIERETINDNFGGHVVNFLYSEQLPVCNFSKEAVLSGRKDLILSHS
jgi:hypothetical protein